MGGQTTQANAGKRNAPETSEGFRAFGYSIFPDFLFIEEFRQLSSDAKELYVRLYNMIVSGAHNCGLEEGGECSVSCSRMDMAALLGVSERTAVDAMRSLREAGLVEEKRSGQGMANRICVRVPGGPAEGWKIAEPARKVPPTWREQNFLAKYY